MLVRLLVLKDGVISTKAFLEPDAKCERHFFKLGSDTPSALQKSSERNSLDSKRDTISRHSCLLRRTRRLDLILTADSCLQ